MNSMRVRVFRQEKIFPPSLNWMYIVGKAKRKCKCEISTGLIGEHAIGGSKKQFICVSGSFYIFISQIVS